MRIQHSFFTFSNIEFKFSPSNKNMMYFKRIMNIFNQMVFLGSRSLLQKIEALFPIAFFHFLWEEMLIFMHSLFICIHMAALNFYNHSKNGKKVFFFPVKNTICKEGFGTTFNNLIINCFLLNFLHQMMTFGRKYDPFFLTHMLAIFK